MNTKFFLLNTTILAALILASCTGNRAYDRQMAGTLGGAAVGGILGSTLTGGKATGAIIGGVAGAGLGAAMTAPDRKPKPRRVYVYDEND